VEVHVIDAGVGFRDHEPAQAFAGVAGGRAGGFGMGMAIVSTIARAHGGTVGAANTQRGADVWMRLPLDGPSGGS
jgi:signal transduction histidine kinase